MNVLHLGKFYPPSAGGMETVLQMLCERTPPDIVNHALVAGPSFATSSRQAAGVQVTEAGTLLRAGAVAICPAMPRLLQHVEADLVVIHEPNPMGLLAYFLARPAAPLVVWFHSEVIRPDWRYRTFYRPLLQFALARASAIVVASPTLAASSPQLAEWRSKCVVIPYGVDVPPDAESAPRMRTRPLVLFVGRLVPYKGADVLVEASRRLDADVVLVGEGPQRLELERLIAQRGVEQRVRLAGRLGDAELRELYRACDVFVLPSVTRQEAFGVVQLEAMAHGRPVICTELGTGTSWVNRHGETGLVIPPRDPGALARAIQSLIDDPAGRAAMGEAALRRVRSAFRVERMIEEAVGVYRGAVRRPLSEVA